MNNTKLLSLEEITEEGNYIAIGNDNKEYDAHYSNAYKINGHGVMFFCIPSHIQILGYKKKAH